MTTGSTPALALINKQEHKSMNNNQWSDVEMQLQEQLLKERQQQLLKKVRRFNKALQAGVTELDRINLENIYNNQQQ